MLLGKVNQSDLEINPYKSWYDSTYQAYNINAQYTDSLNQLISGTEIYLFYGTWCSDSRREVPWFYKILDSLEATSYNMSSFALDRDKVEPGGAEKGYNIEFVPTMVFKRNGEEIGRIIEAPERSLEEDMIRILQ